MCICEYQPQRRVAAVRDGHCLLYPGQRASGSELELWNSFRYLFQWQILAGAANVLGTQTPFNLLFI